MQQMGVAVTQEQNDLEEHQTGRPERRASAKQWQEIFPNQRLNEEEKQRTHRRCGDEQGKSQALLFSLLWNGYTFITAWLKMQVFNHSSFFAFFSLSCTAIARAGLATLHR